MNDKKFIIIVFAFTALILFGGVYVLSITTSTPQIDTSLSAKAYVSNPTSFDWGKVPINGGNVTKSFAIQNRGTETLKFFNVKTSCHCTRAYITINGSDSPRFGMDSLSSWVGEVPSGKDANLTVVFDPAFHGAAGVGPINRFVSVETNDKANPKLTFTLTGTVVE